MLTGQWRTFLQRGLLSDRAALPPLPPPRPAADLLQPEWADFVGAATCGECHAGEYQAWLVSTHGRAGGPAEPHRMLTPFDGRPLQFSDATVTPVRTAVGNYFFVVDQELWPQVMLRVDGVVGGGHMVGGGTQAYFSRLPDGSVRYVPFDYHPQADVWFCDTAEGWKPISPTLSLWECLDWPPTRVMGTGGGAVSCQECHGSQIEARLTGGEVPYQTRWTSLDINCESCHGPGREHVDKAREGTIGNSPDPRIDTLHDLTTDESLAVCLRCHALKKGLGPIGYLPGKPFEEFYSVLFSQLGDSPYYPDGRIRTFAYQGNHLASDCYLSGSMTCVDCHDPHGQGYRDVSGRALEGRFSNGQCLGCHASKADPVEAHTRHLADSPGSLCVNCHMPYRQQPAMGMRLRFARSDHTIAIPRPSFDAELGLETACKACHQDLSTEELDAQVTEWYGKIKPLKDPVLGLHRSEGVRNRRLAAELLLWPAVRHPMAQFAGLVRFMEEHLEPDLAALEGEITVRLMQLARSGDLDVEALALAALHLASGQNRHVRGFLADRLRETDTLDGPLRRRWVHALGYFGDSYRRSAQIGPAIVAYEKALEILPGDGRLLVGLALAEAAAGEPSRASHLLERSLMLDSLQPLTLAELGLLRAQSNDLAGAHTVLSRALELNPWEPVANLNFGHVYQFEGRFEDAVLAYQRAADANPSLAAAYLGLATAYLRIGDSNKAEAAARQALHLEPDDPLARQLLDEARSRRGAEQDAERP